MKTVLFTGLVLVLFSATTTASDALEVDISSLKPGEAKTLPWRGSPVAIIKRTPEQINALKMREHHLLEDPFDIKGFQAVFSSYAIRNEQEANETFRFQAQLRFSPLRSIQDDVFVVVRMTPFSSCVPQILGNGADAVIVDSCSGFKFDLAGRALKSDKGTDNFNMILVPHTVSGGKVILGKADQANGMIPYHPRFEQMSWDNPSVVTLAAKEKNWAVVEQFLSRRKSMEKLFQNTDFVFQLISHAPKQLIQNALDLGMPVDFRYPTKRTPLFSAVARGRTDIVELLLSRGANPNAVGFDYKTGKKVTPLLTTFEVWPIENVEQSINLLIRFGAKLRSEDPDLSVCKAIAKADGRMKDWEAVLSLQARCAEQP